MTCNHCVANVKNAIKGVSDVDKVEVNLSEKKAFVEGNFLREDVIKAIKSAGYTVK